jgi:ribonuclease HI
MGCEFDVSVGRGWVRGHAGHRENERVDRLAKAAIRATR